MVEIIATGISTRIRKLKKYLLTTYGQRVIKIDLPDCMNSEAVTCNVTASFYVNSNFFEAKALEEQDFKGLSLRVIVNDSLIIEKKKFGGVRMHRAEIYSGYAWSGEKNFIECDNEEIDDFEDLEAYEERVHGQLRL